MKSKKRKKTSAEGAGASASPSKPGPIAQIDELLYQALETELGGVKVYRTALRCALDLDLLEEWQKYLGQTERHVEVVRGLLAARGLDPELETPGRQIVRHKGGALITAMEMALRWSPPEAAQLVAAECVVDAETKDHANWELLGRFESSHAGLASALAEACAEVKEEEGEHLFHSQGWARELWLHSLGQPSILPPPEERQDVTDGVQAARIQKSRGEKKKVDPKDKKKAAPGRARSGKR